MTVNEYMQKLEVFPTDVQEIMQQSVDIWSNDACLAYFVVAAKKSGLSSKQICEVYGWMESLFNWSNHREIIEEAKEICNNENIVSLPF